MKLLKNKDFRLLLLTGVVADLSVAFFEIPIIWWIVKGAGSISLVAAVALVSSLAYMVAGPWGGTLADRRNKKSIIVSGLAVDAVATAVTGLLLWQGLLTIPIMFLLLAISSLAGAARDPSFSALSTLLVDPEDYQQATASLGLSSTSAKLSSYGLAGVVTAALGPSNTILIGAALILGSILFALLMNEPILLASENQPSKTDLQQRSFPWDGLKLFSNNPLLLRIVVTAFVLNLILAPLTVLFAPFVQIIGGSARTFGYLGAALMLGQLLGMLTMSLIKVKQPLRFLTVCTVLSGLPIIGLAFTQTVPVALTLIVFLSLMASFVNVQLIVLLQNNLQPETLGRAFGILGALAMSAQPIGQLVVGMLLALVTVQSIFPVMGMLMILAAVMWAIPLKKSSETKVNSVTI